MSRVPAAVLWVAYRTTIPGHADGVNAVCKQSEWEAMERSKPGQHQLIRGGMKSEGEAERLARGLSGNSPERRSGATTFAALQPPNAGRSAPSP